MKTPHEEFTGSHSSMPTTQRSVPQAAAWPHGAGACDRGSHNRDDWYALPSSPEIPIPLSRPGWLLCQSGTPPTPRAPVDPAAPSPSQTGAVVLDQHAHLNLNHPRGCPRMNHQTHKCAFTDREGRVCSLHHCPAVLAMGNHHRDRRRNLGWSNTGRTPADHRRLRPRPAPDELGSVCGTRDLRGGRPTPPPGRSAVRVWACWPTHRSSRSRCHVIGCCCRLPVAVATVIAVAVAFFPFPLPLFVAVIAVALLLFVIAVAVTVIPVPVDTGPVVTAGVFGVGVRGLGDLLGWALSAVRLGVDSGGGLVTVTRTTGCPTVDGPAGAGGGGAAHGFAGVRSRVGGLIRAVVTPSRAGHCE